MEGLVTARQFITEPVRLVHHDIAVLIDATLKDTVQLAEGFHLKSRNIKLMQGFAPVIHKHRRAYDQLAPGGQFLE